MNTLIVTDEPVLWSFLNALVPVISASSYLSIESPYKKDSLNIVNLCRCFQYQSMGYYVSLLAEARQHAISPSVRNIQDSLKSSLLISQIIDEDIQKAFSSVQEENCTLSIYFGKCKQSKYTALVAKLFKLFPLPLMRIEFVKKKKWMLKGLMPLSILTVPKHHQPFLEASAFAFFKETQTQEKECSLQVIAKQNEFIKSKYQLGILIEPEEGLLAPSNPKALEKFIHAGKELGMDVGLVTKRDLKQIAKYDGLFIRATTSVNHFTYQLASYAARNNLVVIDDPQSIVKCTNKIFLAELFEKNQVSTLPTQFINKYDVTLPALDFPCVLKKPDGSCSKGVVKVEDLRELKQTLTQFFKTSDLVLVQPFMPTEFDWRIGIIDQKPLYACRYYMAKNHWQIVDWSTDDAYIHETIPVEEVPQSVIDVALQATQLIGDGLYGVDIKSIGNKDYVIEVNDNPSLNYGYEDDVLKNTLYTEIMSVFLQRLREKRPLKWDSMPISEHLMVG